MEIAVDRTADPVVRVAVSGTVDRDGALRLLDALIQAARLHTEVVLDVSACRLAGSTAVAVLLAAHMAVAANGTVLRLRGLSSGLLDLLHASGLDETLAVEPAARRRPSGGSANRQAARADAEPTTGCVVVVADTTEVSDSSSALPAAASTPSASSDE
jgi:anti-anti-sigma factor